jgi:hypothetical protein
MRSTSNWRWTDDWAYGTCQADFADGTCTRQIDHQGDHAALPLDEMVDEAHDAALSEAEAIWRAAIAEITRRAMAEEEARKAAILAAGCYHPERDRESFCSLMGVEVVVCRICGARRSNDFRW